MMYKNDFVAVLKVDGKILREDKNTVYVPFGSEYSILLKNLYSRRALVSISIDGQDVLNGDKIVVRANDELELERFLESMDEGNRFKFIQKTKNIQEHRGDKVDDGMIRIEFQYEAPEKVVRPILTIPQPHVFYDPPRWNDYTITCNDIDSTYFSNNNISPSSMTTKTTSNISYRGEDASKSCLRGMNLGNSPTSNLNADMLDGYHAKEFGNFATMDSFDFEDIGAPKQDEGITVKGSKSDQKFKTTTMGELEPEKHVITLQLKGFTETGKTVEKPVTVKTKKKCNICGRVNKSSSKFCAECGTFLE